MLTLHPDKKAGEAIKRSASAQDVTDENAPAEKNGKAKKEKKKAKEEGEGGGEEEERGRGGGGGGGGRRGCRVQAALGGVGAARQQRDPPRVRLD